MSEVKIKEVLVSVNPDEVNKFLKKGYVVHSITQSVVRTFTLVKGVRK